jgi:hypothetical protein
MGPARIYPWRRMHQSRAPSIAPGTFFVAQSWAGCITNMPGFNLRQAQASVSVLFSAKEEAAMSKADDLRKQAKEAGKRGVKSRSLREGALERKRENALNDMADNEDWLDGKPTPEPKKKE